MSIKEFRNKLKNVKVMNMSLSDFIGVIATIIVIPVFTIQIINVVRRGRAKDYSLYYVLLQLIGTPEGGGGAISGIIRRDLPLAAMGLYGLFYYCVVLFYYLFF